MATLEQLYQEKLGRAPDPEGLAYWQAALSGGASMDDIRSSFAQSPEYIALQSSANSRTTSPSSTTTSTPSGGGAQPVYQPVYQPQVDYTANFSQLGNQVGTGFTNLGQQVGSGFTGLGSQMGAGFSGLGSQVADVRNQVGTGFEQTQAGLTGLGQGLQAGFGATGEALQSQAQALADTRAAQQAGFDAARTQATEMQTSVLGGQSNIRALVEQYGGDLGRFYQDLARGQTDQQQRLGSLQTGFEGFRGDYDRDVTQASQQRAKLSDTITGGITGIRTDLGAQATANQAANAQIASRMAGLGAQQPQSAQMGLAGFARDLAAGAQPQTEQAVQAQTEFVGRLNAARTLVSDPNVPLDVATRNQLADFSQSFDNTGRLIPRSIDMQGFQVSRAIDNGGRLLMAKFDQNGAQAQQQSLDINRTLAAIDTIMQGGGGGLASPFMTPMV